MMAEHLRLKLRRCAARRSARHGVVVGAADAAVAMNGLVARVRRQRRSPS
jgi:hypothetical protein